MSLISPVLRKSTSGFIWWCPGCRSAHHINVGSGSGPQWTWNGDADRPSFQPSVLVRGIRQDMTTEELIDYDHAAENQSSDELLANPKFGTRCHVYVTDGQIQFLGDCTHDHANKTVPIPPWPYTPEEYHIPGPV